MAVGFKADNKRAVQFGKWANQIVSQYTVEGWVMDKERFINGGPLSDKYFEEQLERIREIRMNERKFCQKITDLYATAIDYDKMAESTRVFYATVQNRMHQTVHGHTAAELFFTCADSGDTVSAYRAQLWAETEFEKFRIVQDRLFMSDYDRYLLELEAQIKKQKDVADGEKG